MGPMTTMPGSRPFARPDLEHVPDDGHRYELVDGALVVTPSPSWQHQRAVGRLFRLLDDACPSELETLVAPFDVALSDDTVLQPDLLVARRSDLTMGELPVAPVLAVEILSPSTRHIDLALKRARYEEAGCRDYWVVDPLEPSIIAWHLRAGAYQQGEQARGGEKILLSHPFPVTVAPQELVGD